MLRSAAFVWCFIALGGALVGCDEPARAPVSAPIRLVELLGDRTAASGKEPPPSLPRTQWRFDGSDRPPAGEASATWGWQAGSGVTGLSVRNGRLFGRTTSTFPVVHVERTAGLDSEDLLHAVEVRMRVSAGSNVSVSFREQEKLDVGAVIDRAKIFRWRITSGLVRGDEMRTYVMRPAFYPVTSSEIRHVLLRPTDAVGASFEVESVRLIFRKEYLAGIPTGVGWHGLSHVSKETIVARSPETIRMTTELPARPWLDLAIGTIDEGAVTFRVSVTLAGDPSEPPHSVVLDRTVTTPHRWYSARVDLSEFSGRRVVLSLSLDAQRSGQLGFWGSPVVRGSSTRPNRASTKKTPRGVILILADTLRSDHLDAYGYARPTAPVLARLASDGVLFRDCHAQGSWTKVSAPAIFTSLYPTTNRVRDLFDVLPNSAVTMAEVFRRAGYATLGLSSSTFIGEFTNLHQGFEELHEEMSLSDSSGKSAREYVDRLLVWLEAHHDVPFFVMLHVFDPHDPYEPRRPYDSLWADPKRAKEFDRQTEDVGEFIADPPMRLRSMPTREELIKAGIDPDRYVAHVHDWYDGSIRGMDVELGRLFERLNTMGISDETLVVFTSDHGEEFLDHGATWHGQSVYGELTHVPLIFHWPAGLAAAGVVNATVQTIDIMPTVLELSGLAPPAASQGNSLVSVMRRASERRADTDPPRELGRWVVSEKASSDDMSGPGNRELEAFALTRGGWKLIHNRERPGGVPEFELFDHRNDPLDQTNVAKDHPERVRELADVLEAWHRHALAARLEPDATARPKLDSEELERLRSLGYVK